MGLRVATLVNLSFLGGDKADEAAARFAGHAARARIIPEAIRRFLTWAPLLIPFYIPRNAEWDQAWTGAEQIRANGPPMAPAGRRARRRLSDRRRRRRPGERGDRLAHAAAPRGAGRCDAPALRPFERRDRRRSASRWPRLYAYAQYRAHDAAVRCDPPADRPARNQGNLLLSARRRYAGCLEHRSRTGAQDRRRLSRRPAATRPDRDRPYGRRRALPNSR